MGATMRIMNRTTGVPQARKAQKAPEASQALERLRKKIKSSLKARVARAREDLGHSQGEVLAELEKHGLGRTQGSLSHIENGARLPSVETLYVLAEFLGTSADYFIGLSESPLSPADIEEELAAAKGEGKIDKLMAALTKEQRAQVIGFAEYLLTQSGRADEIERSNRAAWNAAVNVLQRQHGAAINDMLEAIADTVPELRKLVGPPAEDKSVGSG